MNNKPFYKLTTNERRAQLAQLKDLTQVEQNELANQSLPQELASHLIENQVSEFSVPLGIVNGLNVDGIVRTLALATEEPSVIAACNYGAKMAQKSGVQTTMSTKFVRGQLIFPDVQHAEALRACLEENKEQMIAYAHQAQPSIVLRGGGIKQIEIRQLSENYISCDLIVDPKEAMGANMVNTMLEAVKAYLVTQTKEEILMGILSNYATEAIVRATVTLPFHVLAKTAPGELVAKKIVQASQAAQIDPYRAVTHNKGILNGMEAFVLATGNDTRAFSAAVHAFAAKSGQYRGLSTWEIQEEQLIGTIELPALLGAVGGAISLLPKAKLVHKLADFPTATELASLTAAIGLVQNLAALRALVSEGIQQGHMSLQARALAMSVGAVGAEIDYVTNCLIKDKMNQETANFYLKQYRQTK